MLKQFYNMPQTNNALFQSVPSTRVKRTTFDKSHSNYFSCRHGELMPTQWFDVNPNDNVSNKTSFSVTPQVFNSEFLTGVDCKSYNFAVRLRDIMIGFEDYIQQDANGVLTEPWCLLRDIYVNPWYDYDATPLNAEETELFLSNNPDLNYGENDQLYVHNLVGTVAGAIGLPEISATDDNERWQMLATLSSQDTSVGSQKIRLMPFLAYLKVWNDYFRDDILTPKVFSERRDHLYNAGLPGASSHGNGDIVWYIALDCGNQLITTDKIFYDSEENELSILHELFRTRYKCYEKDYFNAALPWQQMGSPVRMPLGGIAPVEQTGFYPDAQNAIGVNLVTMFPAGWQSLVGQPFDTKDNADVYYHPDGAIATQFTTGQVSGAATFSESKTRYQLYADLDSATSVDIEEFRYAAACQKWLERKARAGITHYEDYCREFYKDGPSNDQTARAIYLGGVTTSMGNKAVMNTAMNFSSADANKGEEDLKTMGEKIGVGFSAGATNHSGYHFKEHMIFISLFCVIARQTYCDGIRRDLQRLNNFDYPNPMFAELGEEPIKNKELFMSSLNAYNNAVFGYAPRYSRDKIMFDEVHGSFNTYDRPANAFRRFSSLTSTPHLNTDFITSNWQDPQNIFYSLEGTDLPFRVQMHFNQQHTMSLPFYGEPTILV